MARMLTILFATLALALPTPVEGQSARVTATAHVVEGVAAGWVHGAASAVRTGAEPGSLRSGRAGDGGSLSHSGRVARRVTVSIRPAEADAEGGAEVLLRSGLQISVDGNSYRAIGADAVEIAPAAGGDQSQSVSYRMSESAQGPGAGDGDRLSVDVVYTVFLIGT